MDRHLQTEIALLNRKGRFLRRMLDGYTDDELKRITPSPSPARIAELLNRANNYFVASALKN
jgi:hypothetical protein